MALAEDRYPHKEVVRAQRLREAGWDIRSAGSGSHFIASRELPGTTDRLVLVRISLPVLLDRVEQQDAGQ